MILKDQNRVSLTNGGSVPLQLSYSKVLSLVYVRIFRVKGSTSLNDLI